MRSPLAAEELRFQDQVGYERLVLGVRPVLAGSPLHAFPAPHVTAIPRRTGVADIAGYNDGSWVQPTVFVDGQQIVDIRPLVMVDEHTKSTVPPGDSPMAASS